MADQHKYTSAVQVTENVARVEHITLLPNIPGNGRLGRIEVVYAIGEETGGTFTQTDHKILTLDYGDVSAAIQTTLDDLEDKALIAGENNGIYPAGSNETIP